MLKPQSDRLDYGAMLMPPAGFRLEHAVATSYSLDLDALISIPVALYFSHSLDVDTDRNLVQLLESIRRCGANIRIYCQLGQIQVPRNQHRLYSLIEPCVQQVTPPEGASFHPKVWALRYVDNEANVRFRVIVMSRNLTFDRSWDIATALEGNTRSNPDAPRTRKTGPLADFVAFLFRNDPPEWSEGFLRDLERTEFEFDREGFDGFEFLPMGIPDHGSEALFTAKSPRDLVVLSPFVTRAGLEFALSRCPGPAVLFSREYELRKAGPDALRGWQAWHLGADAVTGEEKLELESNAAREEYQDQDLHAKVFAFKDGWDGHLLLGSANCSTRGFFHNVEFMIRLYGKASKMGPARLLAELLDEDTLFQKFAPTEPGLTEDEKIRLAAEDALTEAKRLVLGASIEAHAVEDADGNYTIEAIVDLPSRVMDTPVRMDAYFFQHPGQARALEFGRINAWSTLNISERDLSQFLIFRLHLSGEKIEFAIKIAVTGLPNTRESRIFKHIISNAANFFKYLRFLLGDAANADGSMMEDGKMAGEGSWIDGFGGDSPLFETLLVAASREPGTLNEIANVIRKLEAEDPDDERIIPPDFLELWSVFAGFATQAKAKD